MLTRSIMVLALACTFCARAEEEEDAASSGGGVERYYTITDRMPFGREPPGFDPDSPGTAAAAQAGAADAAAEEAAKTEEEQKIIASVRVSALNVTPSGKVAVGFTDNSKQPASNYYLKVGEERDGWKVVDADPAKQTVTLSHGGVEAELELGKGSDGGGKEKGARAGVPQLQRAGLLGGRGPRPAPMPGAAGGAAANESGGNALAALRGRRAQRAADEAAQRAAAAEREKQLAAERAAAAAEREQAKAEREQQMEQLRSIQEELRRQREEKQRKENEEGTSEGDGAEPTE